MAENKTQPTDASVLDFLQSVENEQRRKDSLKLLAIMKELSGSAPVMWGESIIGFGHYHYKYKSGREGDFFKLGFSPRKQSLSIYLMCGFDRLGKYLDCLGKHRLGKGCLYINKLSDVDLSVLKQIIEVAAKYS